MPEVDLSVIGNKTDPVVFEYTWRDVALYALGVGASADALPFVYEGSPGGDQGPAKFLCGPCHKSLPLCGEGY